ncbi:unnamed protein product [Ectocarpus sp. CCAP 1310/34]|nr:unnamed protein product [Ectocarpus sp. CCAP 1310/34]
MVAELLKGSNNGVLSHGDVKRVAAIHKQTPKTGLSWALRWVRPSAGDAHKFHHFFDFLHLDEKWFYICKQGQRYYFYEGEHLPIRKVQHKSHVIKVMFLAAVARPRYDSSRSRQFDGKIGIYPFTVQRAAQRNGRNMAAGTMVTHSVEVNRTLYKKLNNNVFPDIRAKFPSSPIIFAQQENAPGHRAMEDPDVVAAAGQGAGRIELVNQPPNSPDCNILDLGFFNSIQSLQDRTTPTTVEELVAEVERALWAQKPETLGRGINGFNDGAGQEEGYTAVAFVLLARARLRNLRRQSHHSMDLFEVMAVMNVRLTKLVAFISEGQDKEVPPTVLVEKEQVAPGSVLPTLLAQSVFSTRVLAVATGSTTGKAPEAEEEFTNGLQPANECTRKRAELAERSRACFGSAVRRTKALQIQVAQHQPGKTADTNDIVDEYRLPFGTQPLQEDPTATVRRTHALGSNPGPYSGLDTPHDSNHGDDCRRKYVRIDSCAQLSGVNLNAHKQNHAKKKKFVHMLNDMKFDRFAFMVTLINETENEAIHRKSVANMVKLVRGHGSEQVKIFQAQVWFYGRCFCQKSLMRSFRPVRQDSADLC